jgi:hypothetical protein
MIRPSSRRGITVVELSAVATALAVAFSGVALLAHAKSGDDERLQALRDAERIAAAAHDWQADGESGCPTLSVLERRRHLDSSARHDDPWGTRFRISCAGSALTVSSPGPDGRTGTRDDVVVPVD